jgi:tRNA threonylcarbamoyladenosine biosynthesis protein TsaE
MEVVTQNAKETKALGKEIGFQLKTENRKLKTDNAVVLALMGDLGSGKTTFIQGLVKGLGISQRIISPTFIILRTYNIQHRINNIKHTTYNISEACRSEVGHGTKKGKLKTFYHVDLYRLEEDIGGEMKNLGMDEIISDPSNVVAIEWAEKAKDYLPKNTQWIKFEHVGEGKREITVTS